MPKEIDVKEDKKEMDVNKRAKMSAEEFAEELQVSDFFGEQLYRWLWCISDEFRRGQVDFLFSQRARQLGGAKLERFYGQQKKSYQKKQEMERKNAKTLPDGAPRMTRYTHLPEGARNLEYEGCWIADDSGVAQADKKSAVTVCRQPVLITGILKSMDTREETIKLIFKNGGTWEEITCSKGTIASAQKITELHKSGLSVTTQNARQMVAFLQDMEDCSRNKDLIPIRLSTSKLGWNGDKSEFLPFTEKDIEYDSSRGLPRIWDALQGTGSREEWYGRYREMRKIKMVHFLTIAYLSAPIVGMLSLDGFVANLYGESRGGKTVANKIACSIWGGYQQGLMYSADNTENSIDGMLGILRNIPLIMEDLNNMNEAKQKKLQSMVMKISNGTGKLRMTKDINLRETNFWNTTAGITSEFQLIKDFHNAGAINRVLMMQGPSEEDCPFHKEGMDAGELLDFFAANHGFAGKDFTEALIHLGREKIEKRLMEIRGEVKEKAKGCSKSGGQELPVSIMLLADEIAEKYLFCDGIRFSVEEAVGEWMTDARAVNQSERFYGILMEFVVQNSHRFEDWRLREDSYSLYAGRYFRQENKIAILGSEMRELADKYNVDLKLFLKYLDRRRLIEKDRQGNYACNINSKVLKKGQRMYVIRMTDQKEDMPESVDDSGDGFVGLDEELPFPPFEG